jgi:hypothetical protein
VYLGTNPHDVPRYTILGDFMKKRGTDSPSNSSKVSKNRVSRHKPYDVPRYTILGDFTKKKGCLRRKKKSMGMCLGIRFLETLQKKRDVLDEKKRVWGCA